MFAPQYPDAPPEVVTFFSAIDVIKDSAHRIAARPANTTKAGFDLSLATWDDTQVWSASVSFFAFAQVGARPSQLKL